MKNIVVLGAGLVGKAIILDQDETAFEYIIKYLAVRGVIYKEVAHE